MDQATVSDLLKRRIMERIFELEDMQKTSLITPATRTILDIRIDELRVLLDRWGLA